MNPGLSVPILYVLYLNGNDIRKDLLIFNVDLFSCRHPETRFNFQVWLIITFLLRLLRFHSLQ